MPIDRNINSTVQVVKANMSLCALSVLLCSHIATNLVSIKMTDNGMHNDLVFSDRKLGVIFDLMNNLVNFTWTNNTEGMKNVGISQCVGWNAIVHFKCFACFLFIFIARRKNGTIFCENVHRVPRHYCCKRRRLARIDIFLHFEAFKNIRRHLRPDGADKSLDGYATVSYKRNLDKLRTSVKITQKSVVQCLTEQIMLKDPIKRINRNVQ